MRTGACIVALSVLLSGCNKKIDPHQSVDEPTADASLQFTPVDPAHLWAAELIAEAQGWEAVTSEAVRAHRVNFGLCRLPIPGVDDHGPHNAYTIDDLFDSDTSEVPKNPANQFVVNPIGRGHFYDVSGQDFSGQVDKVAATPPAYPVGTVIVKEKYKFMDDANQRTNPHSFGVMIKHEPGYDPDNGDWEYAYIKVNEPNKITGATRGKLANCIDCHSNKKHMDYVFRGYTLIPKAD